MRRHKDGRIIPISLTISPLRDEKGNVVGASKIARDVSHRHRLEMQQQTLYELVARVNRAAALPEIYDAALDAMERSIDADRAAILLCDDAGVMRFVASRRLSETYRVAVEGHSPWDASEENPQPVWIDDVQQATLAAPLLDALRAEGVCALAFVPLTYNKRLLGKFMIYFDRPHLFTAHELRPVQTIASQIAFAIERQRGAEALEALVNERTAALRQVIAQMEEFSYSISHDLRAPVRAMRGYADVILQDHGWRLDQQARELLGRVVRSGTRMDRLIQDLLSYSRVSRREIQLHPVSLDKLVREVIQQYPDLRPECVDIEVDGILPEVIAHEPSLTQVVSNLLSNAVKFVASNGRPRIRISCDQRDTVARLWIQDNGIGIKPELQARLFSMLERLHPEQNFEGTGIGLAIVRKAIERMNGAVGVESDGVSGSRFWFELPLAPEQTDTSGTKAGHRAAQVSST
jgi:signal transduction histidine kinase